MSELVFRGGMVLPVSGDTQIGIGDVASRDGVLVQVGGEYRPQTSDFEIVDATGCIVMPGLVQSHVHMCQTLARGQADDLELLDWLQRVVWPYEAALSESQAGISARLACAELLLGGTTAVLDMGTVHHTDEIFAAAKDFGLRATIGKAMMDVSEDIVPPRLREETRDSINESERLAKDWHGRCGGRLRYAFAPRFVLSCTESLLREVSTRAREMGVMIHTHASENKNELAVVRERTGMDNVEYLHSVGMSGEHVALAHCVWLSDTEQKILADTGTHLLHCPSSNLKLASGVAAIPELAEKGVSVSIGADGAPCNNNLDGFLEMRLAALLHKPRAGSKAMAAAKVLRMATLGGARALGLEKTIGSLEVGKAADVIAVNVTAPHTVPSTDPFSTIVYACRSSDVRHVSVDGRLVVRDRLLSGVDVPQLLADASSSAAQVFSKLAI